MKRDHALRKRAFHQFYEEFQDHQFTLASSLAYSVKADVFRARARNYPSALEASLFRDDVPMAVYDGLIAAVRKNLAPLFRYYELRRRVLGLDELHHYDTYVPLVAEIDTHISFDEAINDVLASLAPLGANTSRRWATGLRGRWCDRYETKGKRSGAFSSGSYGAPPYILMNYKNDVFSDVYTLAHEAGHSMHTWFAQRPSFIRTTITRSSWPRSHRPLTRNCSRIIFSSTRPSRRCAPTSSIVRSTTFAARFSGKRCSPNLRKSFTRSRKAATALTLDVFKNEYRKLLEAYFGQGVVLDPELDLECLRIPHFYNAFYVYKYATGVSAAIALAERVLSSEPGAVEAYLGFLKSGGSKFPLETLQAAGVDMRTAVPVESTLRLFDRRLSELEALL